jgi:hypothetical protein
MMASVNFSAQVPFNVGRNSVYQESISTSPSRQTANASAPSRTVSLNPTRPGRPLAFNPNETFIHLQSTNSYLIADVGHVLSYFGIGIASYCVGFFGGYLPGRKDGLDDGFAFGRTYKSKGL